MSEAIREGDIPGVQLRCRRDLGLAPEAAWRLLVEPSRLEAWLCRRASRDGGTFEWAGAEGLDPEAIETVKVLSEEPPRRLLAALSQPGWTAATRLELELTASATGAELSVLQNGFEHLPLSQSLTVWEIYRRRWRAALERLAEVD